MSKIILSSGIRGIDWQECLNAFAKVNHSIVHYDNVMMSTKGKFDEILVETTVTEAQLKSAKRQFSNHLTSLVKSSKRNQSKPSLVNFYSDPEFIVSGDAWHACNSDKMFMFFFCSPEYYLAKSKVKEVNKQEAIDNWSEDVARIWSFYARYPENTCLISIENVDENLTASLTKILESLDVKPIGFRKSTAKAAVKSETDFEKLSFLIAQNLCLAELKNKSDIQDLYVNLALVSVMADDSSTYHENERVEQRLLSCQDLCSQLFISISELETGFKEQAALNLRLEAKSSELESSNSQFKIDLKQYSNQRDQHARGNEENSTLVKQLGMQNEQLSASVAALETSKTELESRYLQLEKNCSEKTAESELSLLQINQLQEELEATYFKYNDEATLKQKLDAKISDLTSEHELSLLQISQLQEELKVTFSQSNEVAVRMDKLEKNRSELAVENELSLLQINQLQEELEHYYIQYQKMTYSPNIDNSYQGDFKRLESSLLLMSLN